MASSLSPPRWVATWASPTRWGLALASRGRLVAKHWAHRPLQGALAGRFPVRRTHSAPMARQYSLEASSFLTDVLYSPPLQTTLPGKLVLRGFKGKSHFLIGLLAKQPASTGQVGLPCKVHRVVPFLLSVMWRFRGCWFSQIQCVDVITVTEYLNSNPFQYQWIGRLDSIRNWNQLSRRQDFEWNA